MACFLRMHSHLGRGCCAEFPIYHSVPFHGRQRIPIAVAVSSALASVAVVSLVGLGQRIPIKGAFLHAVSREASWASGILP
jgi:hypothetical protein